jgi:hypothetical protein
LLGQCLLIFFPQEEQTQSQQYSTNLHVPFGRRISFDKYPVTLNGENVTLLFQRVDNLERVTSNGGSGPPGPPGYGVVAYPTSVTHSFADALSQLSANLVVVDNMTQSACRFSYDATTPPADLASKTLVLPTYQNSTHLVILHESPGTVSLTVTCDPTTYSLVMAPEVQSLRKDNGTWSAYSGF